MNKHTEYRLTDNVVDILDHEDGGRVVQSLHMNRVYDARLIAAAPELLAALQYIATGGEDWKDCCARARHAIAKATT